MKVSAFYYLQYPDDSPTDPRDAATEMYVEVGGEGATIEHFEKTFSFFVYTAERVQRMMRDNGFFAGRSVIVVDRLTDDVMLSVLEKIVDNIAQVGTPVD
jgi:hypothetical protein